MNIDYSLLLLILVMLSGLIWLFDGIFSARSREEKYRQYLKKNKLSDEEVDSFMNGEYFGKSDKKRSVSAEKLQMLEKAYAVRKEPGIVDYSKAFFPILFAVLIFRSFLFEPFQIPTGSMIPSLEIGDYIVVNKYAYGIRLPVVGTKIVDIGRPERGDVMVFIPPHDPNYFVKRVIGLPGDHVRYDYVSKTLYINGEAQAQEFVGYVNSGTTVHAQEQLGDVRHEIHKLRAARYLGPDFWLEPEGNIIPDGHYFMMGDNRDNSDDSRRWGVVPEKNIVGKAVAVWMHKEPGFNLPTFSENRLINP